MENKKYERYQLLQYQSLPLAAKIIHAKKRIESFLEAVDGHAYVSYSGGKDSDVLEQICHEVDPTLPTVFINTGMESKSILNHVRAREVEGLKVTWLHPTMSPRSVFLKYGYPYPSKENAQKIYEAIKGNNNRCLDKDKPFYLPAKWHYLIKERAPVSHKCCDVLKKDPVKKYEKETGLFPILGTQAQESRLRLLAWERSGCLDLSNKRKKAAPLSIWTSQDILEYIYLNNITIADIYGAIKQNLAGEYYCTGANRTGCVGCLFGYSERVKTMYCFNYLEKLEPKRFDLLMKPLDQGGYGYKDFIDKYLYENQK